MFHNEKFTVKCCPRLAPVLVILLSVNVSKKSQYLTAAVLLLFCILLRLLWDFRLLPRSCSDLRFLKPAFSRLCSLRALSCPATFKCGVCSNAIFASPLQLFIDGQLIASPEFNVFEPSDIFSKVQSELQPFFKEKRFLF